MSREAQDSQRSEIRMDIVEGSELRLADAIQACRTQQFRLRVHEVAQRCNQLAEGLEPK